MPLKTENSPSEETGLSDPETWVDQYGDFLYRSALLRTKDPVMAQDLVDDVPPLFALPQTVIHVAGGRPWAGS
jgi:hypothetical protein